ncbi:aminoglycoside phosphotransferase family protein [Paenibacillus albiflavus]|uniref:Aminoglycoside phosphotransferase family protein n=1 Tax=Paenibacillus albiflavus TaxID=2545760 RepID=A0A4R4EM00_9BACL|nr:aminoglycoside phosphotransferase family protein [Paenibacillus albiflavus]TCZ79348.1 aminoglycoside phosphotransferase family protein [Paenibacillus albiflavus]
MISTYVRRIQEVYPNLHIQDVKQNEIGQNNDVFILNQSLVFRFPKYQQGIDKLKRETELLESISKTVAMPIPFPAYKSFDEMEVGKAFMGYKLIEGSPFWKEELINIKSQNLTNTIASQLVTFLIELHSMDIPITVASQKQHESVHRIIENLFIRIKEKLFPFMRVDAQEKVVDNFNTFLNNTHNQNLEKTLIHGDFGAGNIIWDPKENRVAGVIDFGGAGLGDPAYDFAGILSSYGEEFFEICINLYPGGRRISERVHFYRSTFALQEALHGIDHNDQEAFENGIKEFR